MKGHCGHWGIWIPICCGKCYLAACRLSRPVSHHADPRHAADNVILRRGVRWCGQACTMASPIPALRGVAVKGRPLEGTKGAMKGASPAGGTLQWVVRGTQGILSRQT